MLLAHTVNGGTPSATCWPHHQGRSWLPGWADLARRLGYADQAHFTNAFFAIVGVPPARYASLGA
ncbi:MAG: helix-turn-helix transcriptional regulator [Nocardioidaceae bacterium]|nr:helix-turn-helix transcriptional regulator [Nocardioidaceae bacterium]